MIPSFHMKLGNLLGERRGFQSRSDFRASCIFSLHCVVLRIKRGKFYTDFLVMFMEMQILPEIFFLELEKLTQMNASLMIRCKMN